MLYDKNIDLEKRFNLPLNGPGNYRVRNNIIYTYNIEINAVRHCNLSCRSCSHSSPISVPNSIDPSIVEKDLRVLSKFLKCEIVRVLGGEPLLHPNLEELLKKIKYSNISRHICIVTNGTLLHLLNNQMLQYIDEVHVSLYQISDFQKKKIREQIEILKKKKISVQMMEHYFFRESITQSPTTNPSIIKIIYDTCLLAHRWRTLTVANGYLYRCPQSMVYDESIFDKSDAISIHNISQTNEILEFLESNNACNACSQCLGSVGRLIPHEQISHEKWKTALPICPEDGIDYDCVKSLSSND